MPPLRVNDGGSAPRLQAALGERDALRSALGAAQQAAQEQQARWGAERSALEQRLAGAAEALCGREGSAQSSRSAAQVLQVGGALGFVVWG